MSQSAFAEMIFTGTVRLFYSKEKAEAFAEQVTEAGFNCALTEREGEDLRWRVMALGALAEPVQPAEPTKD